MIHGGCVSIKGEKKKRGILMEGRCGKEKRQEKLIFQFKRREEELKSLIWYARERRKIIMLFCLY